MSFVFFMIWVLYLVGEKMYVSFGLKVAFLICSYYPSKKVPLLILIIQSTIFFGKNRKSHLLVSFDKKNCHIHFTNKKLITTLTSNNTVTTQVHFHASLEGVKSEGGGRIVDKTVWQQKTGHDP
jgi:hypothetical protein